MGKMQCTSKMTLLGSLLTDKLVEYWWVVGIMIGLFVLRLAVKLRK